MFSINAGFDSYITSQSQIAMRQALAGSGGAGEDGSVSADMDFASSLAGMMNFDLTGIDSADISADGARLQLLEMQRATGSLYDSLLSVDDDISSIFGGGDAAAGGTASRYFSEDVITPALEMLMKNPEAAIASQANASAMSTLSLFK